LKKYLPHHFFVIGFIILIAAVFTLTLGSFPVTAEELYRQTNLVSDIPGINQRTTDANLVNSWGIARSPTGPWWVADNGTGVSTVYDKDGIPFPEGSPLVVTIPVATEASATTPAPPTGIVYNPTTDFAVAPGHPATFIFVTEDGTIAGWNRAVDPTNAILKVDNFPVAVYKGATLGRLNGKNVLYTANFRGGTVDVFDTNFSSITLAGGAFTDPTLPQGFAPFNVQNIDGKIFVTFALQDGAKHDDVQGPGNGYVAIFTPDGALIGRLEHGDWMNSPWGVVLAPPGFGQFSGHILVGMFGSGNLAAFNQKGFTFVSLLKNQFGNPFTIKGLWGLGFGNGATAGPKNVLYFAAGIDDEGHGLFGKIGNFGIGQDQP
jgi:uncharacterized protein (TIGR03118 family)